MKDSFAGEAKRLKELDDALPELRTQIDRLKTAINATPEGQLYNELASQNEKLARKLIDLRAIGSTVQHALEQRIRLSRNWLALVHALPLDLNEEIIASCELSSCAERKPALSEIEGDPCNFCIQSLRHRLPIGEPG